MPINSHPEIALLTIQETAKLLRISQRGIRRLLNKKFLTYIKIMGSIRIDIKDVLLYVEEQRIERKMKDENGLDNNYNLI